MIRRCRSIAASPPDRGGEIRAGSLWQASVRPDVSRANDVESYTLEQVRASHARNFGAARSFLYVVGRFDAAAVESAIRQSLGDWKAGAPPTKPQVTPVAARALHFIDRPGAVQSTLQIGLPVIDATHSDYLALTVMNALLGGSFGSRITSNIREQKGYTYSPGSAVAPRLGTATWSETADVTTNVTGASIKEILFEIDRLRNEPPTADELRGIQNYLAGTFVLRNSSDPESPRSSRSSISTASARTTCATTCSASTRSRPPTSSAWRRRTSIPPNWRSWCGDRAKVAEQLKPYE